MAATALIAVVLGCSPRSRVAMVVPRPRAMTCRSDNPRFALARLDVRVPSIDVQVNRHVGSASIAFSAVDA